MNALTLPLLRLLSDGQFHSGQALARHFGVTRATVWNALQQAEALGVKLYSIRGKGYRLPEPISFLDGNALRQALGAYAGYYQLELFDALPSTNSVLMRRAMAGQPHGACVVAQWQTHGRGRRGRPWQAGLGNSLTFSVLWRFDCGAAGLSGLSLAVGVALKRALQELGVPQAGLKWPNDVLHAGRKLAGILIELHGDMDGPCAAVIGIGLNLRLPEALLSTIDQPATSLAQILGQAPDPNVTLACLLRHLADALDQFSRQGLEPMRYEWQRYHIHHGQPVRIVMPDGQWFDGVAEDIDADGALLLRLPQGLQRFAAGEVSLRVPA